MPNDTLNREMRSSPDRAMALPPVNRRENRQRVLLRANIHVVRLQTRITVMDMSRSGLRGMTDVELSVGHQVYISLDGITHVAGNIRWIQDGRFGMKFSKLLDVLPERAEADLIHLHDHHEHVPRQLPRLEARMSLFSWSSAARIRNVSKTGMMVETDLPLIPEQQLLVNLSDGKILDAKVKWVEGERVGIQFATPASILHSTYGDIE